jgi:hypothetical protein
MKKILFSGLLFSMCMLFASCSVDSQTDSEEQNAQQEFASDDGFGTVPPIPGGGGLKP